MINDMLELAIVLLFPVVCFLLCGDGNEDYRSLSLPITH